RIARACDMVHSVAFHKSHPPVLIDPDQRRWVERERWARGNKRSVCWTPDRPSGSRVDPGAKVGYAARDCWTCRRHRLSVERETASVLAASSTDSPAT